jgi:hypothetical protein
MAKKTVNRKELRAMNDAAEARDAEADQTETVKKKAPTKRKSKAKAAAEVRMKLFWGVFSQNAKRVALYEFDQRKDAEARAEELSKGGKSPHFVQKVKEQIAET